MAVSIVPHLVGNDRTSDQGQDQIRLIERDVSGKMVDVRIGFRLRKQDAPICLIVDVPESTYEEIKQAACERDNDLFGTMKTSDAQQINRPNMIEEIPGQE